MGVGAPRSCAAAAASSVATVRRLSWMSWRCAPPSSLKSPCCERSASATPGPAAARMAASTGCCMHLGTVMGNVGVEDSSTRQTTYQLRVFILRKGDTNLSQRSSTTSILPPSRLYQCQNERARTCPSLLSDPLRHVRLLRNRIRDARPSQGDLSAERHPLHPLAKTDRKTCLRYGSQATTF